MGGYNDKQNETKRNFMLQIANFGLSVTDRVNETIVQFCNPLPISLCELACLKFIRQLIKAWSQLFVITGKDV